MTPEEAKAALEAGKVAVPYFDGKSIRVENHDKIPEEIWARVLTEFLTLTPADRHQDARHLVANYEAMIDAVGEEDVLEYIEGDPPVLETVWNFVRPSSLTLTSRGEGEDEIFYLLLEGNIDWEPEHGLLMSWQDGKTLIRVDDYDGHPTHAGRFDNPEDEEKYIYYYSKKICTLR